MSRLPDFRKTIYLGMNAKGETVLIPEKPAVAVWDFCIKNGIKRISAPYKIQAGSGVKITVKAPKSAPTPAVAPKRPDNRSQGKPGALNKASGAGSTENKTPKKEKAEFYCTNCKKDVDNPKAALNGKTQCPHCLRVNTVVGKE